MTSEMTSTEAGATVSDLELKIAGHRKVLAGIGKRRAKFAFAASQGDKEAAASLAEIEVDEANSTTALRNLELALAEAREHRAAAWRREREQDDKAAVEAVREMGVELLDVDREIAAAAKVVQDLISNRSALVAAITEQRVLPGLKQSRLNDDTVLGAGILHAFGQQLHRLGRFERPYGGLDRLVAFDAELLGIEAEKPVLSMVEIALQVENNRGQAWG